MESQQTLGKSTQQTGTLQNSLTTCLICRPGAAGAPGWRQQGPAKQAHTRLNEIRLALLHFVLVSACSPNEPCMVYAWTRTFLPSTSRVWTSQCVSVGLGSTLLVGMVQWDQRVQGECVKPQFAGEETGSGSSASLPRKTELESFLSYLPPSCRWPLFVYTILLSNSLTISLMDHCVHP